MSVQRTMRWSLRLVSLLVLWSLVCGSPAAGGTAVPFDARFAGTTVTTPLTFTGGPGYLLTLQRGTACQSLVNPAAFDGVTHLAVSGGTGQFEGASGTMTKTWSATVLAVGPDSTSLLFGSFRGMFDGTIEVAE